MPRILISASFDEHLLTRQTPGGAGDWDEFQFVTSPSDQAVDGWVVYDDLRHPIEQKCPSSNTLLITGEPESVRRYRSRYTGQFGQIWSSHTSIHHPHLTNSCESQHWHYGMYRSEAHGEPLLFDDLVGLGRPEKSKLMSVICSSKAHTEDHRQRLAFVERLKERFGDSIDVFGRGVRSVQDKSDAIWPYKYHLVLENDHSDYFMTEKLPDAFLGWSYPIYFGGREAYHRLPEGAFSAIDIYHPEQAIGMIEDVIKANLYDSAYDNVAEARKTVLYDLNIMARMAEYWRANLVDDPVERTTLFPKCYRTNLVLRQVQRFARRTFARKAA